MDLPTDDERVTLWVLSDLADRLRAICGDGGSKNLETTGVPATAGGFPEASPTGSRRTLVALSDHARRVEEGH